MVVTHVNESVQSQDKSLCDIAKETESLRNEIRYFIRDLLPQIEHKTFTYAGEEGKVFAPFCVIRQYRLVCLLFAKRLKKYNLDARNKVIVFFGAKCTNCESTESLQLHHIDMDGKNDRDIFEEYGVYIWQYYLTYLDEAVDRLELLCPECHEDAHNRSGLFTDVFREFFR